MREQGVEADDIRHELAAISRRLSELPEDAYEERVRLRTRRHELRALDAQPSRFGRSTTAQLQAELARLQRRREQLLGRRISVGHVGAGGGPGGGGFDPLQLIELNADIDAASGVHDVEDVIGRIEAELQGRPTA